MSESSYPEFVEAFGHVSTELNPMVVLNINQDVELIPTTSSLKTCVLI